MVVNLSIHVLCLNSEYGKTYNMKEWTKGENGYLLYFLYSPVDLFLSSDKCVAVDISLPI